MSNDRAEEIARRKRESILAHARALIEAGRHDEVESVLREEDSTEVRVGLARLYEEHLRALVAAGERQGPRIEQVFHAASLWAYRCYPDPHTEIEGEQFAQGHARDEARLAAILARRPD